MRSLENTTSSTQGKTVFRRNTDRRQWWDEDSYRITAWISSLVFLLLGGTVAGNMYKGNEAAIRDHEADAQIYATCGESDDFAQCVIDVGITDFCKSLTYDEELACLQSFVEDGGE